MLVVADFVVLDAAASSLRDTTWSILLCDNSVLSGGFKHDSLVSVR